MGRKPKPTPPISSIEERALNHFLSVESAYPANDLHRLREAPKRAMACDIIGNIQEEYIHLNVKNFLTELGGVIYDLNWAYKKGQRRFDRVRLAHRILAALGYNPTHDRQQKCISFKALGFEYFKQEHKQVLREVLGSRLNEFYYASEMQHIYYHEAN